MNTSEVVLYNKDANGSIREWAISSEDHVIWIRYGVKGGSMQYQPEEISVGKASRSLDEQIMSRMASRISSQRDKGYVDDISKLGEKSVNTLGLSKPMLAQKFEGIKVIDYANSFIQRKYDGNRCLITNQNGTNIAYTRNGKVIDTIDHIVNSIKIPNGLTVDGELYCHGYPLQTIVSWVKRKQEKTVELKYHLYDIMLNTNYNDRYNYLNNISFDDNEIELVPTYKAINYDNVIRMFREFRDDGYEGVILRTGYSGYEDGKRSKSLIKMKEWHDAEFEVINVHPSADNWGILECLAKNGKPFTVSAPGTIEDKKYILQYKEGYIGKKVTVEYANLTKDGIPFHPVAIMFDKHH